MVLLTPTPGALVTDLPRAVRALWGLDDGAGRRGPKRTLSVLAIGEAAVRIADADGLAAVSMASVAKAWGPPRCPSTGTSTPVRSWRW